MKQCDLKKEAKTKTWIWMRKMTMFKMKLWMKTMMPSWMMKSQKNVGQSHIKLPKTRDCNQNGTKYNGILELNTDLSLKKPKSDVKVKFVKYAKKLKDMVVKYLVSICV